MCGNCKTPCQYRPLNQDTESAAQVKGHADCMSTSFFALSTTPNPICPVPGNTSCLDVTTSHMHTYLLMPPPAAAADAASCCAAASRLSASLARCAASCAAAACAVRSCSSSSRNASSAYSAFNTTRSIWGSTSLNGFLNIWKSKQVEGSNKTQCSRQGDRQLDHYLAMARRK